MTEQELIKRLRHGEGWPITAADCIEKLVKERDELGRKLNTARYGQPDFAWSIHEEAMADLRAKLAKAVEALRPFADALKGDYSRQPDSLLISMGHGKDDLRWVLPLGDFREARDTLAELEAKE